jgi:Stealth protein CR2, conserved region 2/Stealth protein CR1, conserved region 1
MDPDAQPIDAVLTWVDGDDPVHRAKLDDYLRSIGSRPESASATRYRSIGEVDWCVVSLLRFAPFLRRIHIITDAQTPALMQRATRWPAALRDKLSIVDHRTIFAGHEDALPTFNSIAIETMMWRIPGLAEHFVYLNDDFMLLRPVQPADFFRSGQPVIRGRWRVPQDREVAQRIKRRLRRWLGRPKTPRPLHQRTQSVAAALCGFTQRYFGTHHVPHPLRRSTLEAYFASHPEQLKANARHHLRNVTQFGVAALANHCEMRVGAACLIADEARLYLEPPTLKLRALRRLLAATQADARILFACVQSLDEAPADVADETIAWLDAVIGRDPPAAPSG